MLIFLAALGDVTTGLVAIIALALGVFFLMRGPRKEGVAPADAPRPTVPAGASRTPAEAAGEPEPVATTFRQGTITLGGSAGSPFEASPAAGSEPAADRGAETTVPSLSKAAGPAKPAPPVVPEPGSAGSIAPEPPPAAEPGRLRVTSAGFPGVPARPAAPEPAASAAPEPAASAAPEPAASAAPEPAAPAASGPSVAAEPGRLRVTSAGFPGVPVPRPEPEPPPAAGPLPPAEPQPPAWKRRLQSPASSATEPTEPTGDSATAPDQQAPFKHGAIKLRK